MPPSVSLTALVGVDTYQPTQAIEGKAEGSSPSSPPTPSDISISRHLWTPSGARGVFGGQVIAQSLLAASKTVPADRGMGLHSMHCYFLLPAHSSPEIQYRVERLRNGNSYSSRLVRAWQAGREVFVLLASYTLPPVPLPVIRDSAPADGSGPSAAGESRVKVSHSLRFALPQRSAEGRGRGDYDARSASGKAGGGFQATFQVPFPADLLPYEECQEEEDRWTEFLETRAKGWTGKRRRFLEEYVRERKESPVGIARADTRSHQGSKYLEVEATAQQTRMSWLRARLGPDERPDVETVKAMIAYMTDFQFIGTASRSVGLHQSSTPRLGMLASLDHSIHFYPFPDDFDASEPLLHVMDSQAVDVASGRGVVQGRVYTKRGILVAVTAQEGVVRADLKGLEARGLVEGGVVGDEEKEGETKVKRQAKL
ncbi:acyl-CoA thioesterase II [Kwoniella sp. DSM 27419]